MEEIKTKSFIKDLETEQLIRYIGMIRLNLPIRLSIGKEDFEGCERKLYDLLLGELLRRSNHKEDVEEK